MQRGRRQVGAGHGQESAEAGRLLTFLLLEQGHLVDEAGVPLLQLGIGLDGRHEVPLGSTAAGYDHRIFQPLHLARHRLQGVGEAEIGVPQIALLGDLRTG